MASLAYGPLTYHNITNSRGRAVILTIDTLLCIRVVIVVVDVDGVVGVVGVVGTVGEVLGEFGLLMTGSCVNYRYLLYLPHFFGIYP